MSKRTRLLSLPALVVVVGALLLSACGGSSTNSSSSATAVAAPMPARSGTFAVGHDTITIPDAATGKTITADLWYPAVDGAKGTFTRYSLLPTAYFDSKVAIEKAPINSAGNFPFVVYSHGSGGQSFVASFLTEDIASHGYVVLSANHDGNTAADQLVGTTVTQDVNDYIRPNVVEAEINPKEFYRVSRKLIVPLKAVKEIQVYSNSRLKIILPTYKDDEVIVARERVSDFKEWIG